MKTTKTLSIIVAIIGIILIPALYLRGTFGPVNLKAMPGLITGWLIVENAVALLLDA